jgi:hypothetical protein
LDIALNRRLTDKLPLIGNLNIYAASHSAFISLKERMDILT